MFEVNNTDDLCYLDVTGTMALTTTTINVPSNSDLNRNSTYRLPKEINDGYFNTNYLAEIDYNTYCYYPTTGTPTVAPTFTVTVSNGSGASFINWYPMPDNNTTLSDYNSATPTIISATSPYLASYYVTVTDANDPHHQVYSQFFKLQLQTSGSFDLAGHDSPHDRLDEPNSQPDPNLFWGPDMWNRLLEDGDLAGNQVHIAPVYVYTVMPAPANYLYVRIYNAGCSNSPDPASPTPAVVKLYWTAGGADPETWDPATAGANYWVDKIFCGLLAPCPPGIPQGQPIATLTIPQLTPGQCTVLHSSWTPPDPQQFSPTTRPVNTTDLCFLARIVDGHFSGHVDGMTTNEVYSGTIGYNVRQNNNIFSINTSVLYAGHFKHTPGHLLFVGSGETSPANFSLQFANEYFIKTGNTGGTLNQFMNVKVYLGDLYDIWQQAGGSGTYAAIDATEKSVTFDGTNTMQLDGIPLNPGDQYPVTVSAALLDGVDGTQMPNDQLLFSMLLNGNTYTCFGYNVKYDAQPVPPGVLAVTEISQGPSTATGCEYAEMIVGNCGGDYAATVDVSGWIIDDNSGNFNTTGCTGDAGITPGHYRLAYNSVWQNVPIGSQIVVYNADANCYNLPATFTVDYNNNIYWLPVPGAASIGTSVIERHNPAEGEGPSSYCTSDVATVYTNADAWGSVIALAPADAIQVRCPGCTQSNTSVPAFYHGLGYAPDDTYCFTDITASSYNLGGALEYNTYTNQKYVFTGSTAADFSDYSKWTAYNADAAGTPPASLGYVNSDLQTGLLQRGLGLPCCASADGGRQSKPLTNKAVQDIKVYPNPASNTIYFQFPEGDVTVRLMNITGWLLNEKIVHNGITTTLNVSGYTPGLYIYQVITDGKTKSGKIIIE